MAAGTMHCFDTRRRRLDVSRGSGVKMARGPSLRELSGTVHTDCTSKQMVLVDR